jgi:hypothetical protein
MRPPKRSDSVTGAAAVIMSVTSRRFWYDVPSVPWRTMPHENWTYCCGSVPWSLSELWMS